MAIKKIICVDDDKQLLAMYQEILTSAGYETHIAENGIDCGCLIPVVRPDLIILDLTMPEMGGIKTINILAKSPNKTSYLLVVSGNLHETEKEFLNQKKIPYLDKPIDFEFLLSKIQNLAKELPPLMK